jgi:glycerol uptake facilitator-like aquaporin
MVFGAVITASTTTSGLTTPETNQNTSGLDVLKILYISLTIGFAYMANIWTFLHVSGGFFNPAVS